MLPGDEPFGDPEVGRLDEQPWQSSFHVWIMVGGAAEGNTSVRHGNAAATVSRDGLSGRHVLLWGRSPRSIPKRSCLLWKNVETWRATWIYTTYSFFTFWYIYIYICVCYFFMWFCSMQRKLYNHLTSILYEKHIHMRVLFHCEMCFSQNPMRYQVEDQKLWLIDESTGWWEEKKYVVIVWRKPLTSCTMWTLQTSCSSGLNPVFLLCNGNNSNIYIYICKTCAIYVYKEFQLDWNTWTPTYICILRSHIQYMNKCMMLSCDRSVCHNIHKYHCRCRK